MSDRFGSALKAEDGTLWDAEPFESRATAEAHVARGCDLGCVLVRYVNGKWVEEEA